MTEHLTEQTNSTYTTSSIAKWITALMIDFFLITFTFAAIILFCIEVGLIDENNLTELNSLLFLRILILIIYLAKDSFKGISYGKWIMGIMIRDDNEQKSIPSFLILFLRNLYLILLPIELIVLISSKNKKRLGDKYSGTIVLNNPVTISKLYRVIVLISIFIFLFGFIALLGHMRNWLSKKKTNIKIDFKKQKTGANSRLSSPAGWHALSSPDSNQWFFSSNKIVFHNFNYLIFKT